MKEFQFKGGVIVKPNPTYKAFEHLINGRTKKFFNRYHQKVTIADDFLFVGSINIAEEYSNIKYGTMGFVDLNIYLKKSPSQKKVLRFFHEILNENLDQIPQENYEQINQLLKSEKVIETVNENGTVVYNEKEIFSYKEGDFFEEFLEEKPPERSEIQDNIFEILENAQSSITIVAPYYLNLTKLDNLLIKAMKKGVKVQIYTSHKRDQPAYKNFHNSELFQNLIKNGAEVYEFLDKVLHLKAYNVDNKILNLGSMNNDITSFALNNEANYLIKRNDFNSHIFQRFDKIILEIKDNSRKIGLEYPKSPTKFLLNTWWKFFIFMMEWTVSNRTPKYKTSNNE
jgi:cardiolipin synthase